MHTVLMQPARRLGALLALAALVLVARPPAPADAGIEQIRGTGWASFAACVGCGIGAVGIVAGGPGSIIAAINFPGGGLIAAGCVAACVEAIR